MLVADISDAVGGMFANYALFTISSMCSAVVPISTERTDGDVRVILVRCSYIARPTSSSDILCRWYNSPDADPRFREAGTRELRLGMLAKISRPLEDGMESLRKSNVRENSTS